MSMDGRDEDPQEFAEDAPLQPRAAEPAKPRPLWRRALLPTISFFFTACVLVLGLLVFQTVPKLQKEIAKGPDLGLAIIVQDSTGLEIGSRGGRQAPQVPFAELPPYLVKAIVATEDRRFYEHHGIDFRGIGRAAWTNLKAFRVVEGGSTITQQVAKNLYLTTNRTYWRKAQEAIIALWLESHLSKDEILGLYLNRIYLGAGTYGVEAASRYYFGKSARNISLAEAALLAGLPKSPNNYAPTSNIDLAHRRANVVIERLVSTGDLTEQEAAFARANPAQVTSRDHRDGLQYFVDWVADQATRLVDEKERQLIVRTTLDPKRQVAAEKAIQTALASQGAKSTVQQGALISLAPDGAVQAMVGGKSYLESQFNRAVQAKRQPGSSFKPIVYAAALENGFTPDSIVDDSPITVGDWSPQNASRNFSGEVTLTDAIGRSINTVAVRVGEQIGVKTISDMAARLGITSPIQPDLTIALGSSEVSLIELTSAYSTFADEGKLAKPYGIAEISSGDGRSLYEHAPLFTQAISPDTAHAMTYMLHRVTTSGTGARAAPGDRPVAGKTGTTQTNRDAWFVGYSGNEIVGVWFGNDNNASMGKLSGGNFASVAWRDYMRSANAGLHPVMLAGADDWRPPEARVELKSKGFFNQLAELFGVAPRLEEQEAQPPEENDRPWGQGFRRGGAAVDRY